MEPATCERIISRINAVMSPPNDNLGDFDIVFAPGDTNVSPVVVVEGNVGLASWCVKHVYSYAYNKVLQHKDKIWRYEDCESVSLWTQFCLLIRPEVITFWNLRRKLLKKGLVSSQRELQLTKLILSRKPKCMEAFYQRQWVFTKVAPLAEQANRRLVTEERHLCTWAAGRHQNNYHAWNHRLWLLKLIVSLERCLELLQTEFQEVKEWTEVHVSEHSGLHYMNKLVELIITCSESGEFELREIPSFMNSPKCVYEEILKWNKSLICKYPGHESLFCARRTLLLKYRECSDYHVQNTNIKNSYSHCIHQSLSSSSDGDSNVIPASCDEKRNSLNSSVEPDNQVSSAVREERGACSKGKGELRSDPREDQSSEVRAVKRTCIENVTSEWATFVVAERQFAEQCIEEADTAYDKVLAGQYKQAVTRMGI